jgi:tRNA-guanine family transglycosylase
MYNYIPAGYLRKIYVLYVQYKDKVSDELSYSMKYIDGKQVTIFNLPDRIVTVAPQSLVMNIPYDYSEVLDLRSNTSDANVVNYSLVSAENLIDKDIHHLPKRKGHRIFGDSGGAQLRFGSSVFVNPYEVIEAYNDVVDLGVALDVAPRPTDNKLKGAFEAAASIQSNNNKIFAENAREDLVLLNVAQGYSIDKKLEWADRVQNDRFTGWAFGSAESDFNLCTLNFAGMISKLPESEHYHIFGVGSPYSIAVFAYLGKWTNYLTSDSTTYIQAGRFRRRFNFTKEGRIDTQVLSKTKVKMRTTKLNVLDCNCAVCKALKYSSAFDLNCGVLAELLIYHNAVAIANYSHFCNNLARTCKDSYEYYNYLSNVFPKGDSNMQKVITSLNIVDCVMNDSLEAAKKKFVRFQANTVMKTGSIFASAISTKEDYDVVDDANMENSIGLNGFGNMWSACADIIPRYMTKERMQKYGIDISKIPGIEDWKEVEEYRKKKKLLETSNIWIAELLEELKKENKYPIEIIKNDVVKKIEPQILERHWEYPLSVKDKNKMLDIIRKELDKDYKTLISKHKELKHGVKK